MKLQTIILTVVIVLILAISAICQVLPAYNRMKENRREVAEKEELYNRYHAEYQTLDQHVHDLKNDPAAIEKEAREKYNHCRPGEIIYKPAE